jgi:hypothetical protein
MDFILDILYLFVELYNVLFNLVNVTGLTQKGLNNSSCVFLFAIHKRNRKKRKGLLHSLYASLLSSGSNASTVGAEFLFH